MLKCNLHLSGLALNAKAGLWASLSCSTGVVSRPTYLSADLGFIAILLSAIFLCLLFFSLPSELAGRNSTKTGDMLGSKYNLKTHVRNVGYSLSTNRGWGQNHLFDDFTTAILN